MKTLWGEVIRATLGAEVALLLSMMVPEKTAELHARGWQYGEERVASGVAYPSDWETAHIGATLMAALMMQKRRFSGRKNGDSQRPWIVAVTSGNRPICFRDR